jgi:hypothetical protein
MEPERSLPCSQSSTGLYPEPDQSNQYYPILPVNHGMARPQVVDRGDGLEIYRVAANILNKLSQTADRGGPPAWECGMRLTTPHGKK